MAFIDGKLRKVEDVTHYVWLAKQDADGEWSVRMPRIAVKYAYQSNHLIIRRVDIYVDDNPGGLPKARFQNDAIHIISPTYFSPQLAQEDVVPQPFESSVVCNTIFVRDKQDQVNSYLKVGSRGSDAWMATLREEEGKHLLGVNGNNIRVALNEIQKLSELERLSRPLSSPAQPLHPILVRTGRLARYPQC